MLATTPSFITWKIAVTVALPYTLPIDALSTGFTTASYRIYQAFVSSLIIAVVTFFICVAGVKIGKKFGVRLANKAQLLGGAILILIGIKICFFG